MKKKLLFSVAIVLWGCDQTPLPGPETGAQTENAPAAQETEGPIEKQDADDPSASLVTVLEAQPDEVKARYQYRNPKETLEFFGIEPGMSVVEALPGDGWYSRILVSYLGDSGRLIEANYAHVMRPEFGSVDQHFVDSKETWITDFPEQHGYSAPKRHVPHSTRKTEEEWRSVNGAASVEAFEFTSLPEHMVGQANAVLLIRVLHDLALFESNGGFLSAALGDVYRVLKPGGVVGVVQHEARPQMSDEWANGNAGYLKKQFVIDIFTEAGFEYVDESAINQNPDDQPTVDEVVWRLPPSYRSSNYDPQLRARMDEIGESNRMTVKFRKPGD